MAGLDNLVVTMALPSIREHQHASLAGLQWTVNAYTLTFAVLLLTGATLGEIRPPPDVRHRPWPVHPGLGRRRARRGHRRTGRRAGGPGRRGGHPRPADAHPAVRRGPAARRGLALGAWGAVGGLAIAIGPLVGGAVVEGASWQWIFWLNVPIGIALLPVAWARLTESYGPATRLDLRGVTLASLGLFGIVLGVVRGNDHGWTSMTVLPPMVIGALLVAAFLECGRPGPPSPCCRCGCSAAAGSPSPTPRRC